MKTPVQMLFSQWIVAGVSFIVPDKLEGMLDWVKADSPLRCNLSFDLACGRAVHLVRSEDVVMKGCALQSYLSLAM